MQKNTTGASVSRFAVMTVLAYNKIEENHLDADAREATIAEITATLQGERGITTEKLVERTADRCFIGSALLSINGVGLFGCN